MNIQLILFWGFLGFLLICGIGIPKVTSTIQNGLSVSIDNEIEKQNLPIHFELKARSVLVYGEVENQQQIEMIETKLKNIAGIQSVENLLVVHEIIPKEEVDLNEKISSSLLYFESNSTAFSKATQTKLDEIIILLNGFPRTNVKIIGHSDSQAGEEINLVVSEKRALAVLNYFVSKGFERKHLQAVGLGENRPIADNDTEAGRRENRRVEFQIIEEN